MDLNKILDISKDIQLSLIEYFEISQDAFFIFDNDFRIAYINFQVENFLKIKREWVIGKILWSVFPLSKEFLISEKYYKAVNDRIPQFWEVFSRSTNLWTEISVYPLKNGNILVNIRDITKRKHNELGLGENEHSLMTSFEKIDDALMIIEPLYDEIGNINNYKFIKVNDIFEKYTGLKNNNLIGKTIIQTSLEIEFSWLANCDEVDQTGKLKHFIDFNKTTRRWHEVFCFPYENNKVGILFKDITNKVQVREALYRSGKRYKAFMMACFDSVYSISSDWSQINIVKEKGAFVDIQKSDSDWMKKYIHSDDRLYITNEINKAILNKSVFDLEHRTLKEDGSLGWAHLRAVPITNNNGDIVEWLGSVSDITLKKEFELKLIEREKEYIEILDSSILGSYIRDFEMKECYVSGIWKKRLGLEDLNSSEIFFEYSRVHHPEDSERIEMFKTNSIKEKRSKFSVEYRVKTIDSGYIWVLGQTKVIYNEQGKPIKSYGTHIDITDRMLAEEALRNSEKKARELIAKLRKASEHKKDFISTLSHELRNPLATITMALSLTEHVVSGSNQDVSMREIIKCQTTQLIRLVDDLLDVTRIGRNKIELTKGNIEINEVVREVLEEFKVQFNENGVVLENEYYADPLYVNADIVRIKQVISNLLSNSLKFTEKRGAVRLTVSKDDDRNVVIKISDTGIGIDPELLPDLFEPFVQADNSPARSAGGLGLGLSIVKGIIDLHGGSIVAKSEGLGKGAKFIIKLPLLHYKQSISS